ncbi:MAG TPA: hypothetical protein VES42_27550, partial [Pilimelia sp.]|nr:hypothetical protein [Pilimelia sp.]
HLADVHEPGAWVRAAAHRAACRAADRERRDSALRRMLAWTARPPVAPAADPGRGEPGEAARVRALLGRLGRTELAALAWDIDGFTVNETAEAFGLTVDEVTNARRRARAHLARLICTAAPDLWETIRQPAQGKD